MAGKAASNEFENVREFAERVRYVLRINVAASLKMLGLE